MIFLGYRLRVDGVGLSNIHSNEQPKQPKLATSVCFMCLSLMKLQLESAMLIAALSCCVLDALVMIKRRVHSQIIGLLFYMKTRAFGGEKVKL